MENHLSTSEMEVLRKLQRNLADSSAYVRVTCILMLRMGNIPSFAAYYLGIALSTIYRYHSAYLHGGADELPENRHKVIEAFLTVSSYAHCARNCIIILHVYKTHDK